MDPLDIELDPPKLYSKPREGEPAPEMVKIFTLDDVDYFIPKQPPASAILAYMREAQVYGEAQGQALLLRRLIGEDNYAALEGCDSLDFEDFGVILTITAKYTTGLFQRFLAASGNFSGGLRQ